jgi:hypothetical protein
MRRASTVAAPAPSPTTQDNVNGQTVGFAEPNLELDGADCDAWTAAPIPLPFDVFDPIFADVLVGPAQSPKSAGDRRILQSFTYKCEGETVLNVTQIDARVVMLHIANGAEHYIAERPLSPTLIRNIQSALSDVKLLDQVPNGVLDEATILGLGHWAEYRANSPEPYRFLRPAITENLFDAMGVFEKR